MEYKIGDILVPKSEAEHFCVFAEGEVVAFYEDKRDSPIIRVKRSNGPGIAAADLIRRNSANLDQYYEKKTVEPMFVVGKTYEYKRKSFESTFYVEDVFHNSLPPYETAKSQALAVVRYTDGTSCRTLLDSGEIAWMKEVSAWND